MTYKYNPSSAKKIPEDLKYERAKLMYQYRVKQKMEFERIGRMFGITRARAKQIIDDFKGNLKQRELDLTNKNKRV